MSKIAITADLHLNNNPYGKIMEDGLPLKISDNFKAFNFLIDECIKNKVDKLIVVGDVQENHNPTNKIRLLLNEGLQKLLNNKISVVLLSGNHDFCMDHHSLEPVKGWSKNVKVIDTICTEKLDDIFLVYLPHTHSIQHKETTFKAYVEKLKILGDKGRTILFGHMCVSGAFNNDKFMYSNDEDVSILDLEDLNYEACFLGHFHKRQSLSKKNKIFYVGSLDRQTFTEKDQVKGFAIYDTNLKDIQWIDYNARKMIELVGSNFDDIMLQIKNTDIVNSILKIKVNCSPEEYANIQQRYSDISKLVKSKNTEFFFGLEKIKNEILSKKSINIEYTDSINIFTIAEEEIKNMSDISDKDDVNNCLDILAEIKNKVKATSKSVFATNDRSIKFKWIKLHNFCRFGETNNFVDFDKVFDVKENPSGIASIMGCVNDDNDDSNGAGKSTILEAILYVLYEKMPRLCAVRNKEKKTTTEIVRTDDFGNYACTEAYAELCFEVDGVEWTVKRGRKVSKSGNSHSAILNLKKGNIPYNDLKKKDPNQVILDLIGVDFEPMCNSIFFAQKDTSKLFSLTQKGKIDVFLNVLSILDDIDDALKIIRENKSLTKEKSNQLEYQINSILSFIESKNEGEIISKISDIEKDVATYSARVEKLKIEKQEKLKQAEDINFNIQQLNTDILLLDNKLKIFYSKIEDESKLIKSEISLINNKIKNENERKEAYEKNLADLRKEYLELSNKQKLISIESLEEIKLQVQNNKEEMQNIRNEILKNKDEISRVSSFIGEKNGMINSISKDKGKIDTLIESCKDIEDELICCPYCNSMQKKDYIIEFSRNLANEILLHKDVIISLDCEKILYEQEILKLSNREKELSKFENDNRNIDNKILDYKNNKDYLLKLADKAKTVKSEYLEYSGESIITLQNNLNQKNVDLSNVKLSYQEKINEINNKLTVLKQDLKNKYDLYSEIVTHQLGVIEFSISSTDKSIIVKNNELVILNNDLKVIKEYNEKLSIEKDKLEKSRRLYSNILVVENLFSSEGIRSKIVDAHITIFNKHMSDFISILTSGKINIKLEEGSLEAKITGASSNSYEMLSGGEQDVARLAANLALGMISLGSSKALPETLFMDEVFGSLAPTLQSRVFDLLDNLRGYFNRILVITHNPSLQEKFSKIIMVKKNNGISSVFTV